MGRLSAASVNTAPVISGFRSRTTTKETNQQIKKERSSWPFHPGDATKTGMNESRDG
jgi:hypothetical protein